MAEELIHATAVARDGQAVLLFGPSGAGKSDLALRLMDRGWRLVSDDQTLLRRVGGRLVASAPDTLAGLIELRGVGIRRVPVTREVEVALAIELCPASEIERLPEPRSKAILDCPLPCVALDPFARSSEVKLELLMQDAATGKAAGGRAGTAVGHRSPAEDADPATALPNRIVLMTGLSGAGRSTALKALEDLGYEAIDNLPLDLLERILPEAQAPRPLAVGVDVRTRRFAAEPVLQYLDRLGRHPGLEAVLVFLDCTDDILMRRFSQTRRPHPLAEDRPIADGIAAERRLLSPLQARADQVVDTSNLSPANLRQVLRAQLDLGKAPEMTVFIESFSYGKGLPRQADLVFDARFLTNPHYHKDLRPLTGQDRAVAEFVTNDPSFASYFAQLTAWVEPQLPRFEDQGKSYLTLAVGCTGGRHRSVVLAERLAEWLRGEGRPVILAHRDLDQGTL